MDPLSASCMRAVCSPGRCGFWGRLAGTAQGVEVSVITTHHRPCALEMPSQSRPPDQPEPRQSAGRRYFRHSRMTLPLAYNAIAHLLANGTTLPDGSAPRIVHYTWHKPFRRDLGKPGHQLLCRGRR